jgi:hypothetical protein
MSERAGPDAGMAGCTGKKKRREEQRTALVSRGEEIRPSVRGERRRNLHRRWAAAKKNITQSGTVAGERMRTTETQENLAPAERIGRSGWEIFLKQSARWELQLAGEQNTEEDTVRR